MPITRAMERKRFIQEVNDVDTTSRREVDPSSNLTLIEAHVDNKRSHEKLQKTSQKEDLHRKKNSKPKAK